MNAGTHANERLGGNHKLTKKIPGKYPKKYPKTKSIMQSTCLAPTRSDFTRRLLEPLLRADIPCKRSAMKRRRAGVEVISVKREMAPVAVMVHGGFEVRKWRFSG